MADLRADYVVVGAGSAGGGVADRLSKQCHFSEVFDRGRDAHCWAPPAQIRTSSIRASGSYLGCLTAKR